MTTNCIPDFPLSATVVMCLRQSHASHSMGSSVNIYSSYGKVDIWWVFSGYGLCSPSFKSGWIHVVVAVVARWLLQSDAPRCFYIMLPLQTWSDLTTCTQWSEHVSKPISVSMRKQLDIVVLSDLIRHSPHYKFHGIVIRLYNTIIIMSSIDWYMKRTPRWLAVEEWLPDCVPSTEMAKLLIYCPK